MNRQGQTITGTCASGSCDGGTGGPSSSSCPTDSQFTGNAAYIGAGLKAAPLRGSVACVDAGPLATRPTATVGNQGEQAATNIYGPNEAGFTSQQPGMSCLGSSSVQGGIDTNLAEAMVHKICGQAVQVLDTCGGHAVPYHYHEKLSCLYSADATTKHSTRIGTALDGHGIYGKYIAGGVVPTDLDACGGRVGVTPDSNGAEVYYYPVTDTAPFTVGCFANKAAYPVSVAQCKALYSGCSSAPVTVTTAHGSGQYILDCPCFDKLHSNVADQGLPGYLDPSTPTPGAQKVVYTTRVTGYTVATFSAGAQDAYRGAVAKKAGVVVGSVALKNIKATAAVARLRRLSASSAVQFDVEVAASTAAQANTALAALAAWTPAEAKAALVAELQAKGEDVPDGLAVAQVAAPKVVIDAGGGPAPATDGDSKVSPAVIAGGLAK
eukprot:g3076.t1